MTDFQVIDIDRDWVILALPGDATRSVHAEDLSEAQILRAFAELPRKRVRKLKLMLGGEYPRQMRIEDCIEVAENNLDGKS